MKKIVSLILSLTLAMSMLGALSLSASAETTCYYAINHQTVTCKMGSYYTGDFKFLTNNTPPEEGNPFENQYMAKEANGKFLVVEVTLEDVKGVSGECPNPDEITLCVAAQSDTTEWADTCNGYPNFRGIGDTIRISTLILPEDYSVTPDEYWQFIIQLGITDEAYDRLDLVKGESKFEAVVSLKSYISDKPYLMHENFWSAEYINWDDRYETNGDINNDGVLDVLDVAIARAYIVGELHHYGIADENGKRDVFVYIEEANDDYTTNDEDHCYGGVIPTVFLEIKGIATGDMNSDNALDIVDVVMMRKAIVG